MTPLRTQRAEAIAAVLSIGSGRARRSCGAAEGGAAAQSRCVLMLSGPWRTSTGTTPHSNTRAVATTVCPLNRTPRADDGRLVPAGLLAHGSMRIASAFPPVARQWHLGRRSPLTVAGAAAALRPKSLAPRSLFTRRSPTGAATRPSRGRIEATRSGAVNCLRERRILCACALAERQRCCRRLLHGVLDDAVEQRVDGSERLLRCCVYLWAGDGGSRRTISPGFSAAS